MISASEMELIHHFLLNNPSSKSEVQIMQYLIESIGIYASIYFMYHVYLNNDIRCTHYATQQQLHDEQSLHSYIDELYKHYMQCYIDQIYGIINDVNIIHVDANADKLMANELSMTEEAVPCSPTSSVSSKSDDDGRFLCKESNKSYASKDGVLRHYKKRHGPVAKGPRNYCVTI